MGIAKGTLDRSRVTGRLGRTEAPQHIRIGARVVYDTADLDAWLEQNKRRSTSEMTACESSATAGA